MSNGTTSLRSETRLGGVDGADVNQLDERVPDAVTDFGGIGADDLMGGEFADLDLPQVTLDGDKVTVDNTSKTAEGKGLQTVLGGSFSVHTRVSSLSLTSVFLECSNDVHL